MTLKCRSLSLAKTGINSLAWLQDGMSCVKPTRTCQRKLVKVRTSDFLKSSRLTTAHHDKWCKAKIYYRPIATVFELMSCL